jgi:hypothetical protein
LESIGEVSLKGIVGRPVCAKLVRLRVQLADDWLSADDYISLMFAVCSELNETCLLSIPAVNALNDVLSGKLVRDSVTPSVKSNPVDDVLGSYVVTRSQAQYQRAHCNDVESSDATDTAGDNADAFVDVDVINIPDVKSEVVIANAREFANEQRQDESLTFSWKLARLQKGGYVVKDELLYHREKRCDQFIHALCVPTSRRQRIFPLTLETSHFGVRNTKARIITSGLWWPSMVADVGR